jgi:RimJ/RimL family protein N-acetyltransferase
MTPVLATRRLTLRPLMSGDAAAVTTGIGNYDVARWMSSVPYPYAQADAEAFIARLGDDPTWAICVDDGLQGVISTGAELGYWLARPVWGLGYATEAGDAAIDAWFARGDAGDLRSGYLAGNDRSARVLAKLGFIVTGDGTRRMRALGQDVDSTEMVLTRTRWRERRSYALVTPRLVLRELRSDDWHDLQRIGGDARVAPMLSSVQSPWPEDAVRRWIDGSRYRGRAGFRAAVCKPDGTLIGCVGMGRIPGTPEITASWFIDPAHWGRGYATEAVGAFLADTMARFDVPVVEADHFVDNPASGAVMRRLGFRHVGDGSGASAVRPGPAATVIYRLDRADLRMPLREVQS